MASAAKSLTGGLGEAEWYAYSVAWLAFAAAAFALGLIRHDPWLRPPPCGDRPGRRQVFLSDMAQFSGALRALSFLGSGAALVASAMPIGACGRCPTLREAEGSMSTWRRTAPATRTRDSQSRSTACRLTSRPS